MLLTISFINELPRIKHEFFRPVRLKTARKSYSAEPSAEPGKNFCVNHALRSTFGRFDTSKSSKLCTLELR